MLLHVPLPGRLRELTAACPSRAFCTAHGTAGIWLWRVWERTIVHVYSYLIHIPRHASSILRGRARMVTVLAVSLLWFLVYARKHSHLGRHEHVGLETEEPQP